MKANPLKQSVLLAAVVGLFCLALAAAGALAPMAVLVLSRTHSREPRFCFSRSVSKSSRFRLVDVSMSMYFPDR